MQVTKQKSGPCTFKLRIEVDAAHVDNAFKRAWREFARFTRVPGFRPGKAPRPVLERYVDREDLTRRVMRILAAPSLSEALEQENLTPFVDPDLEPGDLVEGQPWTFEATVVVEPMVSLADITGQTVNRPKLVASDADVDRTLDTLREQNAVEEPVEGRGVEKGDIVYFDRVLHMEGEEPEEPFRDRLTVGNTIPDIDNGILGQTVGETRVLNVHFPDDFHDKNLAGRRGTIQITLQSITTRRLPEPSDEWIRSINAGESLEDFRQRERERLQKLLDDVANEAALSEAIEMLVTRSTVEYPELMLDAEVQEAMVRLRDELTRNGLSYKQYLEAAGITAEQHEERLTREADNRIRTRLVLREFARQHDLRLSDEEITQATELGSRLVQLRPSSPSATAQSEARTIMNRMLFKRIGDRVMQMVVVVDRAPEEQEK